MQKKIAKFQLDIKDEKKKSMIDINNLERDKINAVHRIQEEMDYKVKETQANLMALNDEQLKQPQGLLFFKITSSRWNLIANPRRRKRFLRKMTR